MNPVAKKGERGFVYTFYSFKGGVGRTMALANVAALLAKWGHSVLVVDWDLEAPGIERFFARANPDIGTRRSSTPGVVDLLRVKSGGAPLHWRDCLLDIRVGANSSKLSLISAGEDSDDYPSRLQSLDFPALFEESDLGTYIEELREAWLSEFEFVLVDSRTGVSDLGGICTVHLADALVLMFTTTDSSTDGAIGIVDRARKAQEHLPLDRRRLLAVPVPARDESRTEYEKAAQWKSRFAERFRELYRDWLPAGTTAEDALELLRIPYVPYWSFGEQLPAIEEGTSDPASLGHAYEILARMLATRLDWYKALEGQTLAPPPTPRVREIDAGWLEKHRQSATRGLAESTPSGFMEVVHWCPDSTIDKSQKELLDAATQSMVNTFGWPIGIVLANREEYRPRPTSEGIIAKVFAEKPWSSGKSFDYWSLNKAGDFYALMSLFEDDRDHERPERALYFDTRIVRTTEALLHCANLYKLLGVEPNAHIKLMVRYGGLRERTLTAASRMRVIPRIHPKNLHEDEVSLPPITFRLGSLDNEIVTLVKKLCAPLFTIFDYAEFEDSVYQQIVTDFVNGKVT